MAWRRTILRIEVGQFSDPGRKRPNNEDWLGTFQPEDKGRLARKGNLFLVADGMGGHQSGEMASRAAVDQVIRTYMDDPDSDLASSLRRSIEAANATLHTKTAGRELRGRWGTTLVAAALRYNQLWIANVGDSRAYLMRGGKLGQLSRDHALSASALGIESSEGWIGRHLITRALGLKASLDVDVFPPRKLRPGDRVLLCSDGLTTPLSDDEIRDISLRFPPQEAAGALVRAANDRGGPDNVSVIIVDVVDSRTVFEWRTLQHSLARLARPGTWRQAANELQDVVFADGKGYRSPKFLGAMLLLALALIILGFVVGWLIFRLT
jgi:serine/threonine protein phosphatase PrpC